MVTAPASYRDVFSIREFSALFSSRTVSMLGDVIAAVALTVLVYDKTGSTALAASTFSLLFLPFLLGGPFLSAVVDRLPPRRTLVLVDLTSACLVGVMAIPGMPVWGLLALLLVLGLIAPVSSAVGVATVATVLPAGPRFILGRSLMRMISQLVQVVGNALGGLLLLVLSTHGVLLVDACSFVASAAVLRFGLQRRGAVHVDSEVSVARDSLSGLRRMLGRPVLRNLMLFGWIIPVCTCSAPEALAAPYIGDIGGSAAAVGLYLAAIPAGTLLSDLVAARLLGPERQRRIITGSALLAALPLFAFIFLPSLAPAMLLLFVSGLGSAYTPGFDGRLVGAMGSETGGYETQGRVLAIYHAGLVGFQGLGFLLWGLVAEGLPPRIVIPLAAGIGLVGILWLRPRQESEKEKGAEVLDSAPS